MNDDATLLRDYAEQGSETAFRALVQRHVDLVYGAALRRTGGDAHRAADVAQEVFTKLAQNARKLSRHTALGAWLHTATRNAALNRMISDQRRKARDAQALASAAAGASEPSLDWDRLQPLLDAAIDELPEADRTAVVLRFLERRSFADIAAALKTSTDAARMRTDRALDKLRVALGRRGITSTAAALAAVVSSQPLVSAPTGLAAALAAQSLAAAAVASSGATFLFFMNTKLIATGALGVLAGLGIALLFSDAPAQADSAVPATDHSVHARTIASLREENRQLRSDIGGLSNEIARLKDAHAALAAQPAAASPAAESTPGLAKNLTLGMARWEVQRAALNNLRQIDAARKQFKLEKGRIAGSVHDLVGRQSYIKTVRTVDGEDYSALAMNPDEPLTVTTPSGIKVTFDPSGANTTKPDFPPEVLRVQELGARLQASELQAVNAYRAANNGKNPPNEQAIVPYFATPKEGADWVEYMEARRAAGW